MSDQQSPPLTLRSGSWSERDIPPRDWIAKGYFLRRTVAVMIGAGGSSKSTLALGYAAGLAFGKSVHGMVPARPCRVMLYNVEDDMDEQERRLSAILTRMGKSPRDVAEKIVRVAPKGAGHLFYRDPTAGNTLNGTPTLEALDQALDTFRPDVLFLDPFAELHTDDENSNVGMREVVAELRRMAVRHDLALVLVHHTSKGPKTPGDMDSARGASSVVSAARVVLTVSTMDESAAESFGISADSRRHYFRVDGAKSNYAELTEAEWFERQSYELENGDTVAVPVVWEPPSTAVNLETKAKIEAAVTTGSGAGPWSPKLSSDTRSIKRLFDQHGIKANRAQKAALADLLDSGFRLQSFRNSVNRRSAQGIRAPNGRPPAPWLDDNGTEEDAACSAEPITPGQIAA